MPIPTLLIKGRIKFPELPDNEEIVPIEYIIKHIKNQLSRSGIENRVLLLRSETASGKSTAIPAELFINLSAAHNTSAPGIICTQPRTITAIRNVAEIVYNAGPSYPNYLKIGQTIGWSTKHNKLRPSERRGLTSATVGTLTTQLKSMSDAEIMDAYRVIIMDEIHERDLQIDMAICMLKKFLLRNATNPKCPMLILMSATFDAKPFADYFGIDLARNYVYVSGASQGHKEMWDWNEGRKSKYYTADAARVVDIICRGEGAADKSDEADILIFMPGALEFGLTEAALKKVRDALAADGLQVFSLLPIDSEAQRKESKSYRALDIPVEEQKVRIGDKTLIPLRRVIISTNIAETGLTLPNLKYVIDSGYNREIEFNPNHGVRALITNPIPESRRIQRRGRAGRKFPGVYYPLFPKYIEERLPKQQLPQILTEDISPIILDIIAVTCDVTNMDTTADAINRADDLNHRPFRLEDIDMLDVPTPDSLWAAMEKAHALGFIEFVGFTEVARTSMFTAPNSQTTDKDGGAPSNEPPTQGHRLTKMGYLARRFAQVAPESVRMILSAWHWDVDPRDLITIAAYLTVKSNFMTVKQAQIEWKSIYTKSVRLGTPHFSGEDLPHALFRSQIVFADGFIEGIILFNALSAVKPDAIDTWCAQHYLVVDAVLMFLKTRDDYINQCIVAGLDVFSVTSKGGGITLETVPDEDLTDYVMRLKYCIYDGYRLNMLRLGEDGQYRSPTGLIVKCPQLWAHNIATMREKVSAGVSPDARPKVLLYDDLSMKYNQKTNMYTVACDRVSALDGYVAFDERFCV